MPEVPADQLVACPDCARAVGLGWWGSIARHNGPDGNPVCVLCKQSEATLTAAQWMALAASLAEYNTANGLRRAWHEDGLIGAGAADPARVAAARLKDQTGRQ